MNINRNSAVILDLTRRPVRPELEIRASSRDREAPLGNSLETVVRYTQSSLRNEGVCFV